MKKQSQKKPERIERVKKKLYNPVWKGNDTRMRPTFYSRPGDVSHEWEKQQAVPQKEKIKRGVFVRWIFIISSIFFLVAVGIATYLLIDGGRAVSSNSIDIAFEGPAFVSGGDEALIRVFVTNNNTVTLESSNIVITYPAGFYAVDATTGETLTREFRLLGDIAPGETKEETIRGVVFGSEGVVRNIKIAMEYQAPRSSATFITDATYTLSVDSAPLSLTIDTLGEITVGQETDVLVSVQSNTETPVEDVTLSVSYPPGFVPLAAEPVPTTSDNSWFLGTLLPGDTREIRIRGVMRGVHNDEKTFHASLGVVEEDSSTFDLIYNETLQSVVIKDLFLGVSLALDGEIADSYVITPEKRVRGVLSYVNNLSIPLRDAVFEIDIEGDSINKYDVSVEGGFYDSSRNRLIWDPNTSKRFEEIDSGERGEMRFSFATKPLVDTHGTLMTNPEITLSVSIGAIRESEGSVNERSDDAIVRSVRVHSDMRLSARAAYASGPIVNEGTLPPRAEKETTYTIVFIAANTSNDLRNVTVVGELPIGVEWKGVIEPYGAPVSYNSETREVMWSLGGVDAGDGILRAGPEVAFQVGLIPSVSQISSTPDLVTDIVMRAYDSFTDTMISSSVTDIMTTDVSDPGFDDALGRVEP
jgi:hypothetical protein